MNIINIFSRFIIMRNLKHNIKHISINNNLTHYNYDDHNYNIMRGEMIILKCSYSYIVLVIVLPNSAVD
jgi:hypothetical protein